MNQLYKPDVVSPDVVRQAMFDFAAALAETPQFKAFEQAREHLHQDEAARQAMEAFQSKQNSLQALLMLNAVSADEQAELERLRDAFVSEASAVAYFQAEAGLRTLCQTAASAVSQSIGLDFAAACGSGCC